MLYALRKVKVEIYERKRSDLQKIGNICKLCALICFPSAQCSIGPVKLCAKEKRSDMKKERSDMKKRGKILKLCALIKVRTMKSFD